MFPRHPGSSITGLVLAVSLALASGVALAQGVPPSPAEATETSPPSVVSEPAPAPSTPAAVVDAAAPAPPLAPPATALAPTEAEIGERQDLPHNLSPLGMFLAADWVVKGVMISLAFASLVTWTIWLAKTLQLAGARVRAARGLKEIEKAHTLKGAIGQMERRRGVVVSMLASAAAEIRLSDAAIDHVGGEGVKERVASALSRIEAQAGRRIAKGTGVLATIGSTAPFVGLFGTVWGIMNSFIGISESQTTNLAVVAPGIAEALLATAIGLVAAIPAVIIYNVFARSVAGYRQMLGDAAAGIERLVSRDLDYRKVPNGTSAAALSLAAE
ncbi:MAG: tonB-system energizer ExbB [Allorhizobium sp.]